MVKARYPLIDKESTIVNFFSQRLSGAFIVSTTQYELASTASYDTEAHHDGSSSGANLVRDRRLGTCGTLASDACPVIFSQNFMV